MCGIRAVKPARYCRQKNGDTIVFATNGGAIGKGEFNSRCTKTFASGVSITVTCRKNIMSGRVVRFGLDGSIHIGESSNTSILTCDEQNYLAPSPGVKIMGGADCDGTVVLKDTGAPRGELMVIPAKRTSVIYISYAGDAGNNRSYERHNRDGTKQCGVYMDGTSAGKSYNEDPPPYA
jgi:hypothetical protein